MIKNEQLKKILTNTVFKVLTLINRTIPKNDKIILLYTNMGFRDNIFAIYDYIVNNNYNKKYIVYISSNEPVNGSLPENVRQITNVRSIFLYLRAGHVFYAFGKIPIHPTPKQYVVQMWHGTPFKSADEHQMKTVPKVPYYTKVLVSSEFFREIIKAAHGVHDANIAICGQPRTDIMFRNHNRYNELCGYTKVIMWMPTFRKSDVLGYSDIQSKKSVIPVIEMNEYKELNNWLNKNKVLLLVKLHPLEDVSQFLSMNLSNLWLLSHKDFISRGWDLYTLIAQCDAMITDYSSVFYDFMLLDRPLAFTVDDYADYKNGRGFAVKDPDYLTAGYKIATEDDLKVFIQDLLIGKDSFQEQRREVNRLVNTYNDGKQCKRALSIANVFLQEAQ